ncbi:hypothetical protein [Vitiosangium sp. GDMCC 1.1324]|uniref:hypothetical protein n=1 Tax=Vitiosangium sp. (strain GDMCC 1.1324) TaxID=2138576 RepID=UPI001E42689F|nr:hypothetical protein [Vitiosangium sp. GDMCC 1.1324]
MKMPTERPAMAWPLGEAATAGAWMAKKAGMSSSTTPMSGRWRSSGRKRPPAPKPLPAPRTPPRP